LLHPLKSYIIHFVHNSWDILGHNYEVPHLELQMSHTTWLDYQKWMILVCNTQATRKVSKTVFLNVGRSNALVER